MRIRPCLRAGFVFLLWIISAQSHNNSEAIILSARSVEKWKAYGADSRRYKESQRLKAKKAKKEYFAGHSELILKKTCPAEFTSYLNKCYLAVKESMDWKNANNYCKRRNSHLLSVSDSNFSTVIRILKRVGIFSSWISFPGKVFDKDVNFKWSTNKMCEKPDNLRAKRQCGLVHKNHKNKHYCIDKSSCRKTSPFICTSQDFILENKLSTKNLPTEANYEANYSTTTRETVLIQEILSAEVLFTEISTETTKLNPETKKTGLGPQITINAEVESTIIPIESVITTTKYTLSPIESAYQNLETSIEETSFPITDMKSQTSQPSTNKVSTSPFSTKNLFLIKPVDKKEVAVETSDSSATAVSVKTTAVSNTSPITGVAITTIPKAATQTNISSQPEAQTVTTREAAEPSAITASQIAPNFVTHETETNSVRATSTSTIVHIGIATSKERIVTESTAYKLYETSSEQEAKETIANVPNATSSKQENRETITTAHVDTQTVPIVTTAEREKRETTTEVQKETETTAFERILTSAAQEAKEPTSEEQIATGTSANVPIVTTAEIEERETTTAVQKETETTAFERIVTSAAQEAKKPTSEEQIATETSAYVPIVTTAEIEERETTTAVQKETETTAFERILTSAALESKEPTSEEQIATETSAYVPIVTTAEIVERETTVALQLETGTTSFERILTSAALESKEPTSEEQIATETSTFVPFETSAVQLITITTVPVAPEVDPCANDPFCGINPCDIDPEGCLCKPDPVTCPCFVDPASCVVKII